ncbi:hypothetical protein I6J35_07155 [Staphylococcus condimenti]|uniref:Lipoprotein n=1 Tax=Staphylococcus condimenti TaxID=70255 RepID=A0AB37H3Q8_9STAP|nr:hypothetical protein [Staphylococcus condimenti]AMY05103.1 hypothetical protein A4G25_03820 [Staphylococcus condimenti]QQS83095.1 hypothetical protein I6J05_01870 [Staphylococcus condimenti]QRP94470.1 hypothetical protein I6J35_07155 [Staphylococcus condimenti]VEG64689.1 putative lipoprotein [Staphylococcus condimenti]
MDNNQQSETAMENEQQTNEVQNNNQQSAADQNAAEQNGAQQQYNQSNATEQNVAQQAPQPQQNQAPTEEEVTQKLKSGQNVNGIVDAEGNTWHQAPGGGDAVGITKPDGTTCTVGGCMSPDGKSVPDEH